MTDSTSFIQGESKVQFGCSHYDGHLRILLPDIFLHLCIRLQSSPSTMDNSPAQELRPYHHRHSSGRRVQHRHRFYLTRHASTIDLPTAAET